MPDLHEGYVDHRIRIAEVTSTSDPGRESWWNDVPVYEDARRVLTELLSSPAALKAPLILLGQPGSGKSILTRILVGSLPATDFLPIRVELRKVTAEDGLQRQIEQAVYSTTREYSSTSERVRWPQLVKSAGGALPVVLLDGFDELLQATGVMHNDFLKDVQEFQRLEHDDGRPLAVIVTSRIAVTDRALIPLGATVVRLEPFNEKQINAWLDVWARSNRTSLGKRDLSPLPTETALNYIELAEQPLLLLMLALYDADSNVLQSRSAELGRTELYGRLLKDFANREVIRQSSSMSAVDFEDKVETELLRLSVAAFAMFNRRSQWVQEADLDADLSALISQDTDISLPGGKRARLTAAQLTIGRFFFIHESRATLSRHPTRSRQLRTYEFLHSTFGEFLVARLVVRVLNEMVSADDTNASSSPAEVDDDLLHALLSFAALTARSSIVAFISDLFDQLNVQCREDIARLLLRLHKRALFSRSAHVYDPYEPIAVSATERYAAWSANLVVLAVLAGRQITGSELYPQATDPVIVWRNEVMIWRSQLSGYGWEGLHEAIALTRLWDGQRRDIRLWRNDGTFNAEYPDIFWIYNMAPQSTDRNEPFVDFRHNSHFLRRKVNFICNMSEDIMTHGLEPLISLFPAVSNVFVVVDGRPVSATHAFVKALYAPYEDSAIRETSYLDLARVALILSQIPDVDHDVSYLRAALAVLVSAVKQGIASSACLAPLAEIRTNVVSEHAKMAELLTNLEDLLSDSVQSTGAARDDQD